MNQTTIQNSNSFRIGSAKFEVGDDVNHLENLGGMRGIAFDETWTEQRQSTDNAGDVLVAVQDHQCKISGELMEIDFEKISKLRGGIDNYSTVAAAPVSITNEAMTLKGTSLARLVHRNGDKSEVTSLTLTNTDGSTTYVRNTDYVVVVDADGYCGIARVAGGAIQDGANVLADYTYTPTAHRRLSSGGKVTITPRVIRLTNVNAKGQKFQVTIYAASNSRGINIAFKSDESGELLSTPIEFTGRKDVTREAGDQLFEIVDEQGVSA